MREIEKETFFEESMNSFKASNWTLFLARIFGKKYTGTDALGIVVTLIKWRGVIYLTKCEEEQ